MNDTMSVFDYVSSPALATYWLEMAQYREPMLGERLFGTSKKMGLNLNFIKGANGVPKVLKLSAFDVEAVPRPRIGFETLKYNMPFFKESMYIDEELRQELLIVGQTNNTAYLDVLMTRVFNDNEQLLESARVSRERERMQLITTGTIFAESNGQSIAYDYAQPTENFVVSTAAWSDTANADAVADIRNIQNYARTTYGKNVTRVILNTVTFQKLLNQDAIKNSIYLINALVQGTGQLTDSQVSSYFSDVLGVRFDIYDGVYQDDAEVTQKYIPDDIVVICPDNLLLGTMWFGTTPEEADLLAGKSVASVSIVDTGVAVTTYKHVDPVNVNIKVSQICLPSYEQGNYVFVLDTSDDATRP